MSFIGKIRRGRNNRKSGDRPQYNPWDNFDELRCSTLNSLGPIEQPNQSKLASNTNYRSNLLTNTSLPQRLIGVLPRIVRRIQSKVSPVSVAINAQKMLIEPLEPRILLNADILAVDLTVGTDEQQDQSLLIRQIEETEIVQSETVKIQRIQIIDKNNGDAILAFGDLSDISAISIATGSGADSVTIDLDSFTGSVPQINFDGGDGDDQIIVETTTMPEDPFIWTIDGRNSGTLTGPINATFTGVENLVGGEDTDDTFIITETGFLDGVMDGRARGFDTLVLEGGTYNTVSYSATGPDSGTINLDGDILTYAGLEPIIDNTDVSNRVLALDGLVDNHARLISYDAGRLTLESRNGTFEDVTFNVPTESLTIYLGNGEDVLLIENLDLATNMDLTVFGGTELGIDLAGDTIWTDGDIYADTVKFSGNVDLNGGTLSIDADTITVNAGVTLDTRDETASAAAGDSGAISLGGTIVTLKTGSSLLAGVEDGSVYSAGDIRPDSQ